MSTEEPVFKSVFASMWETLPPVFKKRYSNRPDSNDLATVEGKMDIHFSKVMTCLLPIFKLFRVLVPFQGKNISVKVDFRSKTNAEAVYLERKFYFSDKKPYEFNSRMQVIKANDVIECMSLGIAWRTHYFYDGKKIIMRHKAYVCRIFGVCIRLPLEMFIGKGHAEEEVIDDYSYKMTMTMTHPLLGIMYTYSGRFTFKR